MPSLTRVRPLPLVALDQVLQVAPNRITTRKAITANEAFFPGHYPDQPVYPGVFILEAVNQAVAWHAAQRRRGVRLRRILSIRFRQPLQPGDVLDVDCEFSDDGTPNSVAVKATCTSGTSRIADVKATFEVEEER
jgi:3-hydroxymyristoyl/3-hydroxydecanoyl-(acyl carrier protein) dehydratase